MCAPSISRSSVLIDTPNSPIPHHCFVDNYFFPHLSVHPCDIRARILRVFTSLKEGKHNLLGDQFLSSLVASKIHSDANLFLHMHNIADKVATCFEGKKGAFELSLLYIFEPNGKFKSISVQPTLFHPGSGPITLEYMPLYGKPCFDPTQVRSISKR